LFSNAKDKDADKRGHPAKLGVFKRALLRGKKSSAKKMMTRIHCIPPLRNETLAVQTPILLAK
jgi:hypothetical protein